MCVLKCIRAVLHGRLKVNERGRERGKMRERGESSSRNVCCEDKRFLCQLSLVALLQWPLLQR